MPKPWYSIKAQADVAEISILDTISSWYGVDAKSYLAEFKALKAPKVKLFINSPGGEVTQALAIFNGMRATGKEIEVHVLGVAASAASYIAMAGDKIVMPRNTMMFLHNPINAVYGNADDMREMADVLDKFGEVLTGTYAKRWKGTDDELKDVLRAETFLTATECLAYGLCDEVVDEITVQAHFDVETLPPQVQAIFKAASQSAPPPARVTTADVERIAAAAGVADYAGILALDPRLTTSEALRQRAEEVAEIVALCKLTKRDSETRGLVVAGTTLAAVRTTLASQLASADADLHVDTTNTSARVGSKSDAPKNTLNPVAFYRDFKTGAKQ